MNHRSLLYIQIKMVNFSLFSDLLPPEWRQEIQNNYIGFRDNMENVDNVITHLHQQRVITDSKKQQLDAMPTRSKKIDRLMIDVVLGFTVGSYKRFRQILRDTFNTHLVSAIPDPGMKLKTNYLPQASENCCFIIRILYKKSSNILVPNY